MTTEKSFWRHFGIDRKNRALNIPLTVGLSVLLTGAVGVFAVDEGRAGTDRIEPCEEGYEPNVYVSDFQDGYTLDYLGTLAMFHKGEVKDSYADVLPVVDEIVSED